MSRSKKTNEYGKVSQEDLEYAKIIKKGLEKSIDNEKKAVVGRYEKSSVTYDDETILVYNKERQKILDDDIMLKEEKIKNLGKSSLRREAEQIYFNISIPHNDAISVNGSPTPAVFQEVRSQPLFDEPPNKYKMSVIRFTVPTAYIPLQLVPIQQWPNTDINLTTYSVTLSYGGSDYQTFLNYIPQNTYLPLPPAPLGSTATGPLEGEIRNRYSDYYSLYSVGTLVDMINTAFDTSFTALKSGNTGAPPTQPPFMQFDPTTKLFTLIAQTLYDSNGPTTIEIYMNNVLDGLFDTSFNSLFYGYNVTNGKNVKYLIQNNGNNFIQSIPPSIAPVPSLWNKTTSYLVGNMVRWSGIYWQCLINNSNSEPTATNNNWTPFSGYDSYISLQEFNTLSRISSFTSLVFVTGSLPIRNEWISQQKIYGVEQNQRSTNFLRTITDFEVDLESGFELKNSIHYTPTAQFRYIDILNEDPISNIDVSVYWKDNFDNLYPVLVPAGNL